MSKYLSVLVLAIAVVFCGSARAGIIVYEEGDKKIEIGGLMQVQYTSLNPDCEGSATCLINTSLETSDETVDRTFFRRLRPYIQGTVTKNWEGKIEFDFGEALDGNEVLVKDAFIAYSGFEAQHLKLTIGNAKPPFARELITSSSKQQLVERSFVGDRNFGAPDRALGVRLDGAFANKKVGWAVSLGEEHIDPAANRMDFDTPVNTEADWNEGWLVAGRVDFHPLGELKFDQVDFNSDEWKLTVSAGAYHWANDDDNNTHTLPDGTIDCSETDLQRCKPDLDEASGLEVSGGVRGHGLSVDVELHKVSGDTVDPGFTAGLYRDGTTDLDVVAVEGGYMVVGDRFEIAAGWDSLDADNYAERFERTTLGANYYWNKHNVKLSLNYRMTENFLGLAGEDHDLVFAQAQFLF